MLGVALLCGASLLHELLLTRLFSVILWYHFALAVISLALLGIGAGGVWLYTAAGRFTPEGLRRHLAGCALGFGLAAPAGVLLMLSVPPIPNFSVPGLISLSILLLAAAVPFFFVGLGMGLVLSQRAEIAGRLYAADLAGAGLGCMLLVPLLRVTDLGGAALVIGLLGVLSALLISPRPGEAAGPRRRAGFALVSIAALLGLHLANPWFTIQVTKNGVENLPPQVREWEDWNPFSRVAIFNSPTAGSGRPTGWGISGRWQGRGTDEKWIIIDAAAMTPITRWDGTAEGLAALDYLDWDATSLGHHVRPGGRVLVVGAGGGRDILTSLRFGATAVQGVEINPSIDHAMRTLYRDFSGGVYAHAGVQVALDEARSFLERDTQSYDLIQISMIDTWAASAAGAFVFTEAHLYTLEAFQTFLRRLAPGGLLAVSRWHNSENPGESLRLLALALEALRASGVSNPADHVALIASGRSMAVGTLLMGRDPLTPADLATVQRFVEDKGFLTVWAPGAGAEPSLFTELAQALNPWPMIHSYQFDISPPSDDRPFFFHMLRPRDVLDILLGRAPDMASAFSIGANYAATKVLLSLVVLVSVFAFAFILAPLLLAQREALAATRGPWRARLLIYFACLGLGFMLVEIPMIQRLNLFLGHPIYAFSVVLATVLIGGGIGSFLVRRATPQDAPRRALIAIPVLCAGVVAATFLQPALLRAGLAWETPVRIAAAAAQLLPLGILLGMPLPLGLQVAAGHTPRLIPWLWGVNGALSVVGSVGALCLGLVFGFQTGLLLGVAVYLLGLMMILGRRDRAV